MTAAEWLELYARRHAYELEELRARVHVVPCNCGLTGCFGWQIDHWAPPAPKERTDA